MRKGDHKGRATARVAPTAVWAKWGRGYGKRGFGGGNYVLAIGGFGGDNAVSYDKGDTFFCGRVVRFFVF